MKESGIREIESLQTQAKEAQEKAQTVIFVGS